MTGHIPHHAAKSLIFAQPAPGSQEQRTPVPWNSGAPYAGLGFREIASTGPSLRLVELPVTKA